MFNYLFLAFCERHSLHFFPLRQTKPYEQGHALLSLNDVMQARQSLGDVYVSAPPQERVMGWSCVSLHV